MRVHDWTEPSELRVCEVEPPAAGPGKVCIDVRAAGCNFFDTLIVRGRYQVKPDFPFSPGGEVAGVVHEVGAGVSGFAPGDRVMANVGHGGFVERVNADPAATWPIPQAMSFAEAAALPIAYGTSYVALMQRGALRPGETVLVTGAAGGVGLAAIQIARAAGGRVIALAGGEEKLDVARRAGANVTVDYREDDWAEAVRRHTSGRGADVIVENVGGEIFEGCTRCIAWGGRLLVVGFAGGTIPTIRANRILLKHISLVGVHFGPMLEHEPEALREAYEGLVSLYEEGSLEPVIWRRYPLEALAEALGALEARESWGKIVIEM